MPARPLIYYPNPLLRQKSATIEQVNDEVRATLTDMLATVREHAGLGMGAVQMGVLQRLAVIALADSEPLFLINPVIIWQSDEKETDQEGNLSMPGVYDMVERAAQVRVRYIDRDNFQQELHASGMLARVIQHEIDHTNGVLFFDHLSKLKRDRLLKKYQKLQREAI